MHVHACIKLRVWLVDTKFAISSMVFDLSSKGINIKKEYSLLVMGTVN